MTDTASEPLAIDSSAADLPAEPPVQLNDRPDPAPKPTTKPKKAQPARGSNPVLERLFALYPKMFGARFLPLKLGVFQELMALHAGEFKKEDLKFALGQHARSTRYLESVAAGEKRHDLQGVPVDDVAPEHVHQAILEVFRRRQLRTKEDLRPGLRDRLVKAIETSGLTREAYEERIHTQDEVLTAVQNDAFAVLAEKVARREALRRAFEGSGLGIKEFAEMYGMDAATVRYALERSRADAARGATAEATTNPAAASQVPTGAAGPSVPAQAPSESARPSADPQTHERDEGGAPQAG